MMDEPGGAPSALSLREVVVRFGARPGLAPLSCEIRSGDRVAIVGPSGAGKSSLLRTIAGLQAPHSGEIRIGGELRTHAPPERRGAVYLHQTPLLFPHLDVAGNVAFPLKVRGWKGSDLTQRVDEVLAALDILPLARRRANELSGGQAHRVALARAIVARPPLLLLDEPLSSLDPALRREVREAIRHAAEASGAALLFVTHDLDEAGSLATRIGVLIEGHLSPLLPPEQLFRSPPTPAAARFVGFTNQLDGEIGADGIFRGCGFTVAGVTYPPGPAFLMVRPQGLGIAEAGPVQGVVVGIRYAPAAALVELDTGNGRVTAATPLHRIPPVGSTVQLALDAAHAVVFPDQCR